MTLDQTTAEQVVDAYLGCWNEPMRRGDVLVDRTCTMNHARSVDPLADVTGRAGIDAMLAATQGEFPRHRFSLDGEVTTHHDLIYWGWVMAGPDDVVLAGVDVARVDDGQIAFLAGFFRS